jgi:hypothetical protein
MPRTIPNSLFYMVAGKKEVKGLGKATRRRAVESLAGICGILLPTNLTCVLNSTSSQHKKRCTNPR